MLQQKTGRPVQFEITDQARQSIAGWLERRKGYGGDWLFPSRQWPGRHLSTRQYSRLVKRWVELIGLEPSGCGTYSLGLTKVCLLNKKTGNLRACQLLLGHTKLESTVRYLGVELGDALLMSKALELDHGFLRVLHCGAHELADARGDRHR